MSFLKKTGKAMADVIPGLGAFTYSESAGTVFITSGTGLIGYRVAMSLLEAGHKDVVVGIWKGDRQGEEDDFREQSFAEQCADKLREKGAKVVDFDWSDEECFDSALTGVKTVFCTLPRLQGWSDSFPAFLRKCKAKKVEHFVKISFLRPVHAWKGISATARQYRESVPFVNFHGTCDDLLEAAKNDSRISYTILCASHFMPTPLLMQGNVLRKDKKFISASYGMGVNYVSPNDVADAAVVVVLNQKPHRNKVYNLTGPGPITDAAVAKLLTKAYEEEITHEQMGYHQYKEDIRKRGLPDWLVQDAASFERMKASGIDEHSASYTDDIEKITGHKPESFADYLNNKSCMRPGMTFP